MMWDGKAWNVNDNRLFRARFEKYLNSPEQTEKADIEYRQLLDEIMSLLSPDAITAKRIDQAYALLSKAALNPDDARLCNTIGDAVYASWQGKQSNERLEQARNSMLKEQDQLEWNYRVTTDGLVASEKFEGRQGDKKASSETVSQSLQKQATIQPYVERLAELKLKLGANAVKREAGEMQPKIEFQSLLVQFFAQRRFQHVVIGSRFYRAVFGDGDTKLQVSDDMKNVLSKGTGLPATLGLLDSLSNEAMRDVREGVQAYEFLLEKKELSSASQRLSETFVVGEFMPEIRTLAREKKRQVLDFTQKSNQLISALEVKDYELAEKIVKGLADTARDFDPSKPTAMIETARNISAMHLAKARNAAVSGDRVTFESELKEATEIWPRNPDLKKMASKIFDQTDVQQQAIVDFERLLSQKNFRQIFEDKLRFIAATATYPDKQKDLQKVLEAMQRVETAIQRAQELSKRGDHAGAWESVERAYHDFPNDPVLNQERARYTTEASDFVKNLRRASELEEKGQVGSSLSWYLKAQKLYPPSEYAGDAISRLSKKIVPESSGA
jgi:tetratricopeptide (TPR) repeat protein